jgi:hypothetical protein
MLINLFNAKNPNGKRVPVTVNLEAFDDVDLKDGSTRYFMVLQTGVLDTSLNSIDPIYVNGVTQKTLKDELQKALTTLATKINWGLLEADTTPPIIESLNIPNQSVNVSINTDLFITLQDPMPSSLINPASIKLEVQGIDVSNNLNIVENGNTVTVQWIPNRLYK